MPDEEKVQRKRRKLDSIITKLHQATPLESEDLEQEENANEAVKENVDIGKRSESRTRLSRRKGQRGGKQKQASNNEEAPAQDEPQAEATMNGVEEGAEKVTCNGNGNTNNKAKSDWVLKVKLEPVETCDNSLEGLQQRLGYNISDEVVKQKDDAGEQKKRLMSESSDADGVVIELPRRVECTACGRNVNPAHGTICRHPCLNVLVCKKCNQYYNSGPFTRDEFGIDEQCRWCGDGGSLLCCDKCDKAFCKPCIKRNLGKSALKEIVNAPEGTEWLCFCCNPKPISKLVKVCNRIMSIVQTRKSQKTIFKTKKGPSLTDTPNQKERKSRLNSLTENLGMSSDGALSPSESPTKKNIDDHDVIEGGSDFDDSVKQSKKTSQAKADGIKRNKQNSSGKKDVLVIDDDSDSDNRVKGVKDSKRKSSKARLDRKVKRQLKVVEESEDEKKVKRLTKSRVKASTASKDSSEGSDSESEKQKSKSKTRPTSKTRRNKKVAEESLGEEEDSDSDAEKEIAKSKAKPSRKAKRKGGASHESSEEDSGSNSDLSDFVSMVKGKGKRDGQKKGKVKAKLNVVSDEEEEDEEEESEKGRKRKRSRKSSVSQKKTRKRPRKVTSSEDESESSDDSSDSDFLATKNKRKQSQKRSKRKKVASESDGDDDDDDEEIGRKKKGKSRQKAKTSSSESEDDKRKRKRKRRKRQRKGKKKGRNKHYIQKDSGDSEEEVEEEEVSPSKRKGRKKIRKLIEDGKLAEETKRARKLEEERRKRLLERTRNNEDEMPGESAKVSRLVLESDPITKEPIVEVKGDLLQHLKPHQCKGIQFMYDCVVESVKSWNEDEPGGGCLLAHCMGLGKTLQVVALTHTLMTHKEINMQKVLVVAPLNTVLNWQVEFDKWLSVDDRLEVLILQEVSGDNWRRADMLEHWLKYGGVLIMGYSMYRNLSQCYRIRSKNLKKIFKEALVDPGPDLVICDEGHILRNDGSAISKALNGIKTKRRVVLTGTPLQNNLIEYHCMVSFVKPSLLGTRKEYTNTFVNPIQNGQCADSTAMDVQIMKHRCHVLHKTLEGCVQRRDYSVLIPFLPRKHEYVIKIRLSTLQRKLYQYFLDTFVFPEGTLGKKGVSLFSDYQALMRIWTHPWCIKLEAMRRPEKFEDSDSLDDFVVHTDEEEEEVELASEKSTTSEEEVQSSSDGEEDRRKRRKRREGKGKVDSSSDEDDDSDDEVLPQSSTRKAAAICKGGLSKKESTSTVNIAGEKITVVDIDDEAGTSQGKGGDEQPHSSKDNSKRERKEVTAKNNGGKSRSNSNSGSDADTNSLFGSTRSGAAFKDVDDVVIEEEKEWYDEFLTEADEFNIQLSGKLVLLTEILADAEAVGDKVLVFSQSLVTLDLIEKVLGGGDIGGDRENWCRGCDYFRMDGSTSVSMRQRWADIFNDEDNKNARLFLISTKAGGLGINLVAANRVIVFDVSWNPSHDVQSIFRVFRFGQTKVVYVYRFIAEGTMEEKIYDRQVTKLAISGRVVDEQQIERHFTAADLCELYTFNPDILEEDNQAEAGKETEGGQEKEAGNDNEGSKETEAGEEKESEKETGATTKAGPTKEAEAEKDSEVANDTEAPKEASERPTLPLPKDAVLADLINRLHPKWIVKYHEHDSLLQNIESEKLTEEEMKAAWDAYEAEKSGRQAYARIPEPQQPDHAQTQQQVAERIRLNSEMLQQIQQIKRLQEMQQQQEMEERMRQVRQQREQMYQQQRQALLQEHQRRQDELRRQNQLRFIQHMTQPGAAPQLQAGQNTINVQTQLPPTALQRHPPPTYQSLNLPFRPFSTAVRLSSPSTGASPSPGTPPTINLAVGPSAIGTNPQLIRPPHNQASN